METLALKLLSYSEEKKAIEFTESEIDSIHDIGQLCGKLEILYSIENAENSILQAAIKQTRKELILAIKEIGMLDSDLLTTIMNRIPLYIAEDSIIQQLLLEIE